MPIDNQFLQQANRAQAGSESDPFTLERYRQFAKYFPGGVRHVLDVGGGTGRGGQELKRLFPDLLITGVDCIPERVASMDPTIYAERICAFADCLPADGGSFDAIVAREIIEHVPGLKIEPALNEFFRVLRLKGRLLITTPNPNYIRNKIQGLSVLSDPSHVCQHYPEVLEFRLRMAGFSKILIRGSGKVSRFLSTWAPLPLYGSYLCVASKW